VNRIKVSLGNKRASLGIVLAIFLLVVLFVNPLRAGTVDDDDWAYALSARHLLTTGKYQWHNWPTSNTPFQAYWGALFARFLGYSFSTLRISTLFLAVLGLVAFYYLAKEHGLDDGQATLLTLALLASPLVLRLSFTFMTDVPFLTCLIVAQYLYTRALRVRSYPLMLLGSVAGAAAILTRQFGVALIAGLFFLWVLSKERRRQALLFLTGLALPAVAGLYQVLAAILTPNWAARLFVNAQGQSLGSAGGMLANIVRRPMLMLEYLALYSLPLILPAMLSTASGAFSRLDARWRKQVLAALMLAALVISVFALTADLFGVGPAGFGPAQALMLTVGILLAVGCAWCLRSTKRRGQVPQRRLDGKVLWYNAVLLVALGLYMVAAIVYGYSVEHESALMPYLRWHFGELGHMGALGRGALTLVTTIGAIWLARIFVLRYSASQSWGGLPSRARLLDLVALFFVLEYLVCAVMGDAYVLVLLPYALIAVGRYLGDWLNRYRALIILVCLVVLVVTAMWTRGLLSFSEACWQGGEYALSTGAQPNEVYGCWSWVCYYRFDDYVAQVPNPTPLALNDYSLRWLPEQRERARFWVTETPDAPSGEQWQVLKEIPYQGMLLRKGHLFVIRREIKGP
jgi:hypothetical protein